MLFLRYAQQLGLGTDVQRAVVLVYAPLHRHADGAVTGQGFLNFDAFAVVQLHTDTAGDPFDVDGAETVQLHHVRAAQRIAAVGFNGGDGGIRCAAVFGLYGVAAGRQGQQSAQQQKQRGQFFHKGIPHFRSFSQMAT